MDRKVQLREGQVFATRDGMAEVVVLAIDGNTVRYEMYANARFSAREDEFRHFFPDILEDSDDNQ